MMRITKKSDVYSFGVMLLEIITGRRPVEPAFGEGRNVVQWVREHLRSKRDPAEVVDPRLQGRPDTQVQEILQALGIAILCASNRADDRPTMKDVAALLRGIRHDDYPSATDSDPRKGGAEPRRRWGRGRRGRRRWCRSRGGGRRGRGRGGLLSSNIDRAPTLRYRSL